MFCRTGRCGSGLLGNRGVAVEANRAGTTLVPARLPRGPAPSSAVSYTITSLAAKEAMVVEVGGVVARPLGDREPAALRP